MNFLNPVSSVGFAGSVSPLGSVFAPGIACSRCVGAGGEAASAGLLQQPSLNAMMQGLLMLLMTLMLGRGGGASPLGALTGSAASPAGGGAAGGGGGGAGANAGGAAGGAADASQLQGGTAIGRRLASEALQESTDGDSPGGLCARDVKTALRQVGIQLPLGDAWKMAEPLAKHPKFREIQVSKGELSKLPPGAIVVWDKGAGLPYGHISIALGDGREASDRLRKQMLLSTSYRVFMPTD